jgi:hypothetical protein
MLIFGYVLLILGLIATPLYLAADAVNPAMAHRLTSEDQWRRVTDLERWTESQTPRK